MCSDDARPMRPGIALDPRVHRTVSLDPLHHKV